MAGWFSGDRTLTHSHASSITSKRKCIHGMNEGLPTVLENLAIFGAVFNLVGRLDQRLCQDWKPCKPTQVVILGCQYWEPCLPMQISVLLLMNAKKTCKPIQSSHSWAWKWTVRDMFYSQKLPCVGWSDFIEIPLGMNSYRWRKVMPLPASRNSNTIWCLAASEMTTFWTRRIGSVISVTSGPPIFGNNLTFYHFAGTVLSQWLDPAVAACRWWRQHPTIDQTEIAQATIWLW